MTRRLRPAESPFSIARSLNELEKPQLPIELHEKRYAPLIIASRPAPMATPRKVQSFAARRRHK